MAFQNTTATASNKTENFIEMRVYGLMRGGNHAVIEWMQNQFKGLPVCHLNNVQHGNVDPYHHYSQKTVLNIDDDIDIEMLRTMPKHLLTYSYEDLAFLEFSDVDFVSSVLQSDFGSNLESYLGSSEHRFDLVVIRDPFNCIASRLKLLQTRGAMGGASNLDVITNNWKSLAKHALQLIQASDPHKIVVSYNRWVSEEAYRKSLSQAIMGTFDDSSMGKISNVGGGSSFKDEPAAQDLTIGLIFKRWRKLFELQRYANIGFYWQRLMSNPSDMKVTERWKQYVDEPMFRATMADGEILELSEQLFGEIPGTREFVATLLEAKPSYRV